MKNKTLIAAMLGSAIAFCGAPAHAAINWTYSGNSQVSSGPGGNTFASNVGGVTATGQGYSNTDDGTAGTTNAALGSTLRTGPGSAATYKLETAYLGLYGGGLGVNNKDGTTSTSYGDAGDLASTAPEHAIDNNQRYDSVLFSFSNKVNLTSMTTGYVSGDADITVWYYSGLGTPTLTGNTYGSLGAGWNLLGSYNGLTGSGSTNQTQTVTFANSNYSSYWLIGAYNELVGGSKTGVVTAGDDAFKIAGLTGTQCAAGIAGCGGGGAGGVPEPGTLLLMGAGLVGLVRSTRRREVLAA